MYKDRGIIKWQPFDALSGFSSEIAQMKYERGKISQPILLADKIEDLNYIIINAFKNNLEIEIKFFIDGYIKNIYGHIKKVDTNFRLLILDNKYEIPFHIIIDISTL